jgi:hypothetical protein
LLMKQSRRQRYPGNLTREHRRFDPVANTRVDYLGCGWCVADLSISHVSDRTHGTSPVSDKEETPQRLDNLLRNRKTWGGDVTFRRPQATSTQGHIFDISPPRFAPQLRWINGPARRLGSCLPERKYQSQERNYWRLWILSRRTPKIPGRPKNRKRSPVQLLSDVRKGLGLRQRW